MEAIEAPYDILGLMERKMHRTYIGKRKVRQIEGGQQEPSTLLEV